MLSAPANVSLPFAPAHTLVLRDLNFLPFAREDFKNRDADDKLEMTAEGRDLQAAFEAERMRPGIAGFLDHEDWADFNRDLAEWGESLPDDKVGIPLCTLAL